MKIIDGHIHFDSLDLHDKLMEDMAQNHVNQFNILVVGRDRPGPDVFKQAHGIWLKAKHPDKAYLFGGIDFGGMFDAHHDTPDIPCVDQLEEIMAIGCDGLKLLCGKPDRRKGIGHPLDGPAFEPMLRRLEETRFPVLWHVGDPPEFWNPDAVPLWAKQNRWWYDDTHPPKAQIDREIAHVLQRHPTLNLILPHFFFISQDLVEAGRLLDAHPNVFFDLAPGVEMFHNFTAQHDAARAFFIKYQDRIIYGSDAGIAKHQTHFKRSWMIQQFLQTGDLIDVPEDPFMWPDERPPLRGIALPEPVLKKIYTDNFERFVGRDKPKPLNMSAARQTLKRLHGQAQDQGETRTTAQRVLYEWDHAGSRTVTK